MLAATIGASARAQDWLEDDEEARILFEPDPGQESRAEEEVEEDSPSLAAVAFDAAAVRPLSFVRLVVGCGLAVPVSALALPGGLGAVETVLDVFVGQPYRDTFWGPLGEF